MKANNIYLGLDIDETLIETVRYSCLMNRPDDAEFYFNCDPFKYALYKRNHLDDFLQYVDTHFNLFFYTRATQDYAEQVLKFLGYEHVPLFHRGDTLRIEEPPLPYQREKTIYFKKDLTLIASRLAINIEQLVFIDDVIDDKEITPTNCVIQIPEFNHPDEDCDLVIIKHHLHESFEVKNPVQYIRTLQFV